MTVGRDVAQALISAHGSPLYVYEAAVLRARARRLRRSIGRDGVRWFFAAKANGNREILKVLREEGWGVDAVSIGEVLAARTAGFTPAEITYNGNNVTDDELRAVAAEGVHISVDGLPQLRRVAALGLAPTVGLRLNPDVGAGHHHHVITGGPDAKFGAAPEELDEALSIARDAGIVIDGLQQHIGSGILDTDPWLAAVDVMLRHAERLPDLAFVDFGGGFGVPYRPEEHPFDVDAFGAAVTPRLDAFEKRVGRAIEWRFEPGRYPVCESGTLLVTVTAVKRTSRHLFVGVDSGMNHLIRPALYDAWHPIVNVSRPDAPTSVVRVAGQICESGDLLAVDRELPTPREGDILAIGNAGAYGFAMASTYNLRPRPAEVMIDDDGATRVIRRRETIADLLG